MKNSIRRQALLWIVAAIVLTADQVTKAIVVRTLPVGVPWNPFPFLQPFVNLTHVMNRGAAFGMLPNMSLFFTAVAIVVSLAILYYGRRIPEHQWWLSVSLGLQLGGALGNLSDRLHYGYVIDFIAVRHSPVFNLADSAVFVGVIILAYHLWNEEELAEKSQAGADENVPVAPVDPSAPPLTPTSSQRDGS
ncbi:MAG: signal peptidase II [Chloroflexi bacterium]|nr:signal peptidase II [Chloroflexota bacterium]